MKRKKLKILTGRIKRKAVLEVARKLNKKMFTTKGCLMEFHKA